MVSRYNVLLDEPPISVEVNGRCYPMATDFRVALAYFRLASGTDDEQDKALFGLQLFYGNMIAPDDVEELQRNIGAFLMRGIDREEDPTGPRVFDILEDAGRIYAAFYQVYKINLRKARIHWWVFCELLEALPKGTHLADVIELRGRKFEKWMKPSDRNELQRAKDKYRIGPKVDLMESVFGMLKGIAR